MFSGGSGDIGSYEDIAKFKKETGTVILNGENSDVCLGLCVCVCDVDKMFGSRVWFSDDSKKCAVESISIQVNYRHRVVV